LLPESDGADGLVVETGTVQDTSYMGAATRYEIALERGGSLIVTQQNLETSHDEARELRGHRVRVGWREQQTVVIAHATPHEEDA
jgi:hypothetical protein